VGTLVFDAPTATISIPAADFIDLFGAATVTGGTIDGPGQFIASRTITSGPPLTLGGGLTWRISNVLTVNDAAMINIGDAAGLTATITNFGGASFNLTTHSEGIGVNTVNVGGSQQQGSANFNNAGTLEKTGGTGTSHFSASYNVSSSGTVLVSIGTLEFDGPSNTFGAISGSGTAAFGARISQFSINPTVSNFLIDDGTVRFNNTLTYGGNFSRRIAHPPRQPTFSRTFSLSGGTVMFNSGNTLTLPNTTTLAGGSITGGTLALNGNTEVNGSTLIQATVFQTTARSG
jgi:hypothetical protein